MNFNFFKHLHTVNKHRFKVLKNSFKVGIPFQGLIHDLSKYSYREFNKSIKYYNGHYSPILNERLNEGLYSSCFVHHTNKNKHHYEHYIDFYKGDLLLPKIPYKYSLEYVIDVISASQTYLGKNFNKEEPLKYFIAHSSTSLMHSMNIEYIKKLLTIYNEKGFKGLKKKYTKSLYLELSKDYPNTELIKCYSLNNKFEKVLLNDEEIKKYK